MEEEQFSFWPPHCFQASQNSCFAPKLSVQEICVEAILKISSEQFILYFIIELQFLYIPFKCLKDVKLQVLSKKILISSIWNKSNSKKSHFLNNTSSKCSTKCLNDNNFFLFFVVEMADNVGKMRHGKEALQSFVYKEREANTPPTCGHGRGKSAREGAGDTGSCVE